MAKVTWLGDEDPTVQSIEQYGYRFVKGEPVDVPDKEPMLAKFKSMAVFSVGSEKVDVVESIEPAPVDPEAGTEREAVRRELDARGIEYDGRAKLETLRALLAKG